MKLLKSKRLWGLLVAAGLLIYCFYDFDFHSVIRAILDINYWYLAPLIFLEAIIALIRTVRLKFIIDPHKKVRVRDFYPVFCIGMMTNLLMPYLTGQVARIYLFSKKEKLRKTFLFTTTVLEVLFDGLALIGIILVISLFFVLPEEFRAWHFLVLAGIIVGAAALLFVVSRTWGKSSSAIQHLTERIPSSLKKRIDEIKFSFLSGLETLKSSKHLLVVSVLSVLSWLFQASIVYFLILAFGFDISIWGAVVITTVVTIMMTIVLSPVNIGTFQGATVAAMHPFGIMKPQALAFSFLLQIAIYLPPVILGAFFSFKEGLTFRQLKDEGEKGVDRIDADEPSEPAGQIYTSDSASIDG